VKQPQINAWPRSDGARRKSQGLKAAAANTKRADVDAEAGSASFMMRPSAKLVPYKTDEPKSSAFGQSGAGASASSVESTTHTPRAQLTGSMAALSSSMSSIDRSSASAARATASSAAAAPITAGSAASAAPTTMTSSLVTFESVVAPAAKTFGARGNRSGARSAAAQAAKSAVIKVGCI